MYTSNEPIPIEYFLYKLSRVSFCNSCNLTFSTHNLLSRSFSQKKKIGLLSYADRSTCIAAGDFGVLDDISRQHSINNSKATWVLRSTFTPQ